MLTYLHTQHNKLPSKDHKFTFLLFNLIGCVEYINIHTGLSNQASNQVMKISESAMCKQG